MEFNNILNALKSNLLTPIPLCFLLGIISKVIHGGIKIPKELYYTISIFLLMSIGFMGGHELCKEFVANGVSTIWQPALVTLILGCVTPITAFVVLRYLGKFSIVDSAGIAAHYGSTSAVTFAVATGFCRVERDAGERLFADAGDDFGVPGHRHRVGLGSGFVGQGPRGQSRRLARRGRDAGRGQFVGSTVRGDHRSVDHADGRAFDHRRAVDLLHA